jgi:hypothetical protein
MTIGKRDSLRTAEFPKWAWNGNNADFAIFGIVVTENEQSHPAGSLPPFRRDAGSMLQNAVLASNDAV